MAMRALCALGSLVLIFAAGSAWAGGAAAAVAGASGVGSSTAGADGDHTGRLGRINQHSVKSYAVIRQLVATSGVRTEAAAAAPSR